MMHTLPPESREDSDFKLFQELSLGTFSINICKKEIIALRLIYADDSIFEPLWDYFWDDIREPDELPASCICLMPLIANRALQLVKPQFWSRSNKLNLNFLKGLPKYTWTRNMIALSNFEKISRSCSECGIEIVVIKGISELLPGGRRAKLRPTSDIDILIKPEDAAAFATAVGVLGYSEADNKPRTIARSPIAPRAVVYKNSDRNLFDIDLHLLVDEWLDQPIQLSERIWKNRLRTSIASNVFTPGAIERYEIGLINAFRIGNWANHDYLRYLYDLIDLDLNCGAQHEHPDQRKKTIEVDQLLANWQHQVRNLGIISGILPKTRNNSISLTSYNAGLKLSLDGSLASAVLGYARAYVAEINYAIFDKFTFRGAYRLTASPVLIAVLNLAKKLASAISLRHAARQTTGQHAKAMGSAAKRITWILPCYKASSAES